MPGMTVLQNIMLGLPKRTRFGVVDWPAIAREVAPIAKRVGVTRAAGRQRQGPFDRRELADQHHPRAGAQCAPHRHGRADGRAVDSESESLFAIIRDLSKSGVAVLYVSHRLDEILELCQRVTVFRDGRSVAELAGAGLDAPGAGRGDRRRRGRGAAEAHAARPPRARSRSPCAGLRGRRKSGASASICKKGEVLGLGGLVGAGRSELARLLFGADRPDCGRHDARGPAFAPRSPAAGGEGGGRICAGGATRRGARAVEERRLQPRRSPTSRRSSSARCCR